MTFIQKINPINKDEEKAKFFFDPLYNPQFEYAEEITEEELKKIPEVSIEYLGISQKSIDKIIKKYGSESKYLEEVEGDLITQQEVVLGINTYLKEIGISEQMNIRFSQDFLARTSVHKRSINIRLPIEHRSHSLEWVLNHEVGTHFLRNLNDERQPWHGKRLQFGLSDHLETEEGLAVLHTYLNNPEKTVWIQALYYVATYWASQHSFSELNKLLEKYVDNKERRWKIAVRMKRGLKDTSKPGTLARDQVYMRGIHVVSKWLIQNEFHAERLYSGKISVGDVDRVQLIPGYNKPTHFPSFLNGDRKEYGVQITNFLKKNEISL